MREEKLKQAANSHFFHTIFYFTPKGGNNSMEVKKMANETVNQENNGTDNANQETKTFTQDELNAIVQDRLKREREKYADYDVIKSKAAKFDESEEASKTELQKAQEKVSSLEVELNELKKNNSVREIRAKVAKETNVPEDLLTADTEEACKKQAELILKFAKPDKYPDVHDAGEVRDHQTSETRDQFAEWFDKSLKK